MRVLAVASYPIESAATRFRVEQFVKPLARSGIEVDVRPFLSSEAFRDMYSSDGISRKVRQLPGSVLRRLSDVISSRRYDLLFVQREALFFGPEIFEWLFRTVGGLPFVLDLDDATYVRYDSPTYGRLGSALKFFGKTDRLIRDAKVVVCGNRFIAEYAESKGAKAAIIPTIADTSLFSPDDVDNDPPVIGWVGTHSTFPFLGSVFPVLQQLAKKHRFVLRLVGTGRESVDLPGVEIDLKEWSLEREPSDFSSFDVGLYPMTTILSANEDWLKGKSGFKAIQYLASGVPFVMTPVGVCAEIGVNGETHFNAESDEDWYNSLDKLLSDANFRKRMGERARSYSLENYTIEKWSAVLADVLFSAVKNSEKKS
jgi:glycosyltransferase involved in cell wall biosynthesis